MVAVLQEEKDFIAVVKPEGISAIPERNPEAVSLVRQLEARMGEKLFVVHRLDKEVSGLIVFARNAAMHRCLSLQFERRQVEKTYLALVHGKVAGKSGVVDAPIRQFGSGRMGVDGARGKQSETRWEILEEGEDCSLLRVHPVTGRRHQIRVHLYHMGHPIIGDLRYGEKTLQARWPRVMLHSNSICFHLPDKSPVKIICPPTESFSVIQKDCLRTK